MVDELALATLIDPQSFTLDVFKACTQLISASLKITTGMTQCRTHEGMLLQLEHFIDSQVGDTSQHTPDAQAKTHQMHKGWMEQRHYSDIIHNQSQQD